MIAPAILFLLSAAGLAAALVLPEWSDLEIVFGPSALASLYLLLRAWAARPRSRAPIILDGSNVMHWKDETPRLATLREVLAHLNARGFDPGVVFDANAGYKLFGKFAHDKAFSAALGLPEDRIMVMPKGSLADPAILTAARDLGARVVSNDRYRDWMEDYPELGKPGHLVKGGYRNGALWLDLPQK